MNREKTSVLNKKINGGWLCLIANALILIFSADILRTPSDAPGLVGWGFIGLILMCILLLVSLGLFIRDLIKKQGTIIANIIGIIGNLIILIIFLCLVI